MTRCRRPGCPLSRYLLTGDRLRRRGRGAEPADGRGRTALPAARAHRARRRAARRPTDVAFVRPPVASPAVITQPISAEPRVFVLPADHPLARRGSLELADVAGIAWVAAEPATDGCEPAAWRDDWLVNPRPGGGQAVIGAAARTIDEWREHVVAGRGVSLCPASAETHYARPGLAFVLSTGVSPAALCVAWRASDTRPAVSRFVEVVTAASRVFHRRREPAASR
ncbi:MAG: LysR substrate-binding domain-containing protein [Streptosporangiaceae bacterium]